MKVVKEEFLIETAYSDYEEDTDQCDWCEEEWPVSELTKTDLGWLCDQCIQEIRSRGEDIIIYPSANYYDEMNESLNEAENLEKYFEPAISNPAEYVAKALAGKIASPYNFEYMSDSRDNGKVQFNGQIYGFLKNDDGTFTVFKESLNEDFVDDGVNRKVKTPKEIEQELRNLTNNFTDEDVLLKTTLEDEKNESVNILRKYYSVVEPTDGRTSVDEKMSWVITATKPFNLLPEKFDDKINAYLSEAYNVLS